MPLCYCVCSSKVFSKIVLLVYVSFIHRQEATAAISRNSWDYSHHLLLRSLQRLAVEAELPLSCTGDSPHWC